MIFQVMFAKRENTVLNFSNPLYDIKRQRSEFLNLLFFMCIVLKTKFCFQKLCRNIFELKITNLSNIEYQRDNGNTEHMPSVVEVQL